MPGRCIDHEERKDLPVKPGIGRFPGQEDQADGEDQPQRRAEHGQRDKSAPAPQHIEGLHRVLAPGGETEIESDRGHEMEKRDIRTQAQKDLPA